MGDMKSAVQKAGEDTGTMGQVLILMIFIWCPTQGDGSRSGEG